MTHYIKKLFPIPLYTSKITENIFSIKEFEGIEFQKMDSDNGYISKNRRLLEEDKYKKLKTEILKHVSTFLADELKIANIDFYITTSWVNRHDEIGKHFSQAHNHKNSIFSGIVYLQTDDESGALTFFKSHININDMFEFNYTELTEYTTNSWGYVPKNNDIVIFPSFLIHGVNATQSKQPRYTLAFNIFAKGNFGHGEGQLVL